MMQTYICDLFFQYGTKKPQSCCGFCSTKIDWNVNHYWTDMGLFTEYCSIRSTATLVKEPFWFDVAQGHVECWRQKFCPQNLPAKIDLAWTEGSDIGDPWIHQPQQEIHAPKSQL